jgi:hypothetical protein
MVKVLDKSLYLQAWSWKAGPDEDLRREVYGAKGAFRPKPFGVEYRSLSNSWLQLGPTGWVNLYEYVEHQFNHAVDPVKFPRKYLHVYVPRPRTAYWG